MLSAIATTELAGVDTNAGEKNDNQEKYSMCVNINRAALLGLPQLCCGNPSQPPIVPPILTSGFLPGNMYFHIKWIKRTKIDQPNDKDGQDDQLCDLVGQEYLYLLNRAEFEAALNVFTHKCLMKWILPYIYCDALAAAMLRRAYDEMRMTLHYRAVIFNFYFS